MLLVAVSGGIDSMCLAQKVRLEGGPFAIAHCNFGLRGEESDADEAFVRSWAGENGIPIHVKRFDTKAYASAQKALDMDPSLAGKCYMIMGNIWGSVVCGGNEIEKRAHFWVAVDYMQKAKAADASLTSEANKYISSYAVYYPQTADAFMYDVTDGQSYTVSCGGMRATTTVRTQK